LTSAGAEKTPSKGFFFQKRLYKFRAHIEQNHREAQAVQRAAKHCEKTDISTQPLSASDAG
jgi:hypothetical protein